MALAKANTEVPFELIIVESGMQKIQSPTANCDVYINDQVSNPTVSMNRGFHVARGEYTILLTNDCFVGENWIECLLECFKYPDCAFATLGSTQFGHKKEPVIEEGNWFSVAMWNGRKFFDEDFKGVWDDTDMLFAYAYSQDMRMYRNLDCICEHTPGQTAYAKPDHQTNFEYGRKRFIEKWKAYNTNHYFRKLAGV